MEARLAVNGDKARRALIVEDEPLVLMDLEAQMLDLGYVIAGKASSLERGCMLASQLDLEIDVAVLDVNLGGANSAPIADALQARGVPFLFASGYTETGIPERFRAVVRIAKPYATASLRRALQQLGEKNL